MSVTAFPAAPLVDDFNRANENPAAGWTGVTGVDPMRVVSNRLTGGGSTWSGSFYNRRVARIPFEMQVTLISGFSGGGVQELNYLTDDAGAVWPIRDGFRRGYRVYFSLPTSSQIEVHRTDGAGGDAVVATWAWTTSNDDRYGIRVDPLGRHTHYGWDDALPGWTTLGSFVDQTYTDGYAGLFTDGFGTATWDDFQLDELTASVRPARNRKRRRS